MQGTENGARGHRQVRAVHTVDRGEYLQVSVIVRGAGSAAPPVDSLLRTDRLNPLPLIDNYQTFMAAVYRGPWEWVHIRD